MRSKKALWGFIVVLVLTLVLAGLTMYKIAEVFGLYKTQKALNSFNDFVYRVNDTSVRPVGTKQSLPLYVDKKSVIVGFSRNSYGVSIAGDLDKIKSILASSYLLATQSHWALISAGGSPADFYQIEKEIFREGASGEMFGHFSPRPIQCGNIEDACICLCRSYDWIYWQGGHSTDITCREEYICYNFTNFDIPSSMSNEDFGQDFYMDGGFMIARNYWLGDKEIEARLTGIYITHDTPGIVSVSFNTAGVSKETIKRHLGIKESKNLLWDAQQALINKQYDEAIKKYEEIIDKGYVGELETGFQEQVYYFRAMAYYKKHDKENTLKAMDEALNHVEEDATRSRIREKIAEAEKW